MGDRGNIHVQTHGGREGGVWFYTHWSGSDLPQIVANGLDRGRSRWDDPPYLARILFDQLTDGQQGNEIGYGIDTEPGDNQHPFVLVDCAAKTVCLAPDTRRDFRACEPEDPADLKPVSFEDWIKKYGGE